MLMAMRTMIRVNVIITGEKSPNDDCLSELAGNGGLIGSFDRVTINTGFSFSSHDFDGTNSTSIRAKW